MNGRDEQITELIARTEHLDPERLKSYYTKIRESYHAETVIDQLATIEDTDDRSPSNFRLISNSELRRLEYFASANMSWDMYCKQLGHSVALGEKTQFLEAIQRDVPDVDPTPGVGFSEIYKLADELSNNGFQPSVVLAPIAYMVGFSNAQRDELDWEPRGPYLHWNGRRLKVFWSSQGLPLDRFIVFDHRQGTWHVKLDPRTGDRLTVAIGEQVTPIQGVVWLAETVAKFEIRNIDGYRSFRPGVEPDQGYGEVR